MLTAQKSYSRYLPTSQEALDWKLYVTDSGFTKIDPGSPYPPEKHPPEYMLDPEKGRILNIYEIVYITRGKGSFDSDASGKYPVTAGTFFLLFPGVRHRYRPDPKTGWDECWVGFNGEYAKTLMSPPFFSPESPVFNIGLHEPLLKLFMDITELMQTEPFGYRHIIAAKTIEILAHAYALSHGKGIRSETNEKLIREACFHILEHSEELVDFAALSRRLGTSYSTFRRTFRQHTGLAPNQYLLQIRIRKAESLLSTTRIPIQEIAEKTGFESTYYFSRIFKLKTGLSPRDYRKQSQQ